MSPQSTPLCSRPEYQAKGNEGQELWLAWVDGLNPEAFDEIATIVEAVRLDVLREVSPSSLRGLLPRQGPSLGLDVITIGRIDVIVEDCTPRREWSAR